jgi:hypothetical protein
MKNIFGMSVYSEEYTFPVLLCTFFTHRFILQLLADQMYVCLTLEVLFISGQAFLFVEISQYFITAVVLQQPVLSKTKLESFRTIPH